MTAKAKRSLPQPDMTFVPAMLAENLREAWANRHAGRIVKLISDSERVPFLLANAERLGRLGILEAALVETWVHCHSQDMPLRTLRRIVTQCDRQKLAACGNPPAYRETVTLYRGVGFRYPSRIIRPAWSLSPNVAAWFSTFRKDPTAEYFKPTVYRLNVPRRRLWLYTNDRREQEWVIDPPRFSTGAYEIVEPMPEARQEG